VLIDILFNETLSIDSALMIFLISLVVFVFSLTIHEFAHAFVAYKMGDITPKQAGRVTLNPFKHLSLMGFVLFLFVGIGWAKPVPINPTKFKKYRVGIRWVSIAGVLANILLALISAVLHAVLMNTVGTPTTSMEYVYTVLDWIMFINSYLAMFNLIPIYPLDGFNFITSFMKSNNKFIHYSIKNGFKIVLGVLIASIAFELLFNFDIIAHYLSLLYDWVLHPIANLGV